MLSLTYQSPKRRPPWNKGKLLGQKPPLKLKEVLDNPNQASADPPLPGFGPVQPGHRQQAAGM